jgi:hypothetical protein
MVIIPFNRKRSIKRLKKPILLGKMIELSSIVTYLGLTWRKQVDKVTSKAY